MMLDNGYWVSQKIVVVCEFVLTSISLFLYVITSPSLSVYMLMVEFYNAGLWLSMKVKKYTMTERTRICGYMHSGWWLYNNFGEFVLELSAIFIVIIYSSLINSDVVWYFWSLSYILVIWVTKLKFYLGNLAYLYDGEICWLWLVEAH